MASLSVRSVSKRYGPVRALTDVSLEIRPGRVHAIVGENGAGKSTLVGVLAGFVTPDSGTVELDGRALPLGQPVAIREAGVDMVHQHFMLVPAFTVEENLALVRLGGLGGRLDAPELAREAVETAARLGWSIDPKAPTGGLPVGSQQRVEILKALAGDKRVVIFDEPSAVLAPDEVEDLLKVLRRLADEGKAVVLIAHKLSEVLAVADEVTVLRHGRVALSTERAQTDAEALATAMVGDSPGQRHAPPASGATTLPDRADRPSLTVSGLCAKGDRGNTALDGLDFTVRAGEVLGVGGVDGNGQVELAEVLAGVRPFTGRADWTPGRPRVGYIPQDRQSDGLALSMSVFDNALIAGLDDPSLTRGPFLRLGALRAWAQGLVDRFQVKTPNLAQPVGGLSGGNQQKVVVARTLATRPDLLVAVNPTRGLDLKASAFVHDQIAAAAEAGAAVVLVSTDMDELAALAHRTVYLSRGRFVDRLVGADA